MPMSGRPDGGAEWLEADGLGGFASGTVSGVRTRRYHALLQPATRPPGGRMVLVNGLDAVVTTPAGAFALSSHRYTPGVIHPDGERRIETFNSQPWPSWTFRLEDGTGVRQQIVARHGSPQVAIVWSLTEQRPGCRLAVRLFLSGRDYHAMHHENGSFDFAARPVRCGVVFLPYDGTPGVRVLSNGRFCSDPQWYRNFQYEEERRRGLDDSEDLASPGTLDFDLTSGEAAMILDVERAGATVGGDAPPQGGDAVEAAMSILASERRRRMRFPTPIERAADAYLVRRGAGSTIIAGYPWFTDWGRDTFIALRGLCLATGRLQEARDILLEWSGTVSRGMLPNRFPDAGDEPEFNSVDASLWYVVAVHDYLEARAAAGDRVPARERSQLGAAIEAIVEGYARGTRYQIHLDQDGLIAAGEPGVQLTWMDAKVGDWVVTPRIGKPVEIQALWLNALLIAGIFTDRFREALKRGQAEFGRRYWSEEGGHLHDVVDADHQPGRVDSAFRPNQIFAVGGLPLALLEGKRARRLVDEVERRLWTPLGLRSLAPGEPGYTERYEGGVRERDGAYHQGTVWPWLVGPFVEAWVRVRGSSRVAKREARSRFLDPMLRHLDEAGLGHLSEIADAEPPHAPRGCPFQAWSVGEVLRLDRIVLADEGISESKKPRRHR